MLSWHKGSYTAKTKSSFFSFFQFITNQRPIPHRDTPPWSPHFPLNILPGVSQIGPYIFQDSLGTGSFASVWLVLHELTHLKSAIKILPKSTISDSSAVTRLTRELNFLQQMHHPFVADFYEWLEDDFAYYYVMEFAENGTILKRVLAQGSLS
ncbi:MAG: protein kinase, partial [Holosporaceae bacterium]|nr:protein kinase [Holosporaceae bacterium]